MGKSQSHVEEKEERSTKEKNLAASIAFLRDKLKKYTSSIATTFILLVYKQKPVVQVHIWFTEIQVQGQMPVSSYQDKACVRSHVVSLHAPTPHAAYPNYQTKLDSIYIYGVPSPFL